MKPKVQRAAEAVHLLKKGVGHIHLVSEEFAYGDDAKDIFTEEELIDFKVAQRTLGQAYSILSMLYRDILKKQRQAIVVPERKGS